MSQQHDPETVKARTNKVDLPEKVRHVLEEQGVLAPPKLPNPRMPKIDELARAGSKEGLGFRLDWPEPDEDAEPEDQVALAIFSEGAEEWRGEDDHPAVAAAIALAEYFEGKPKQTALAFGQAAD
jgi:hypothetical protein